jgi:hypothetical protein
VRRARPVWSRIKGCHACTTGMTGPPSILRRPETTGEYLDLVRDRARELFGLHDRGPEDGGAGWGISVGFPPRHERSPGTSE